MKLQIITLEAYDDSISIRDRLAFVRAERALLVLPQYSDRPLLGRKLDLVLIGREAARRGIRLALVSHDAEVIAIAHDLNISVFSSIYASQRGRWKVPLTAGFAERPTRDNAPDPHELLLRRSRERVLAPKQRRRRQIARYGTVGALGLLLLLIAYLLLPAADLQVFPAYGQINTALILTADSTLSQIDVEGRRIPAAVQTLDIETRANIPTTGISDVPTNPASGIAIFTNRIESEVFIPQGTVIFSTGRDPARFYTTAEATLGAGVGRFVNVPILAMPESNGTRGNIEANLIINIEGDLGRLLSVRNPEPTTGGSVREQGVVTKKDADDLLILAREKLRQDSLGAFAARLGGTQIVVPESIRIINEGAEEATYNAFVGDAADTLTLTLRARLQALIIDEQSARRAAIAQLSKEIPPGMALVVESVTFNRGAARLEGDGRIATLPVSASADVAARIDTEALRRRVAGMSISDVLTILDREFLLDPLRRPEIVLYPGFLSNFPALPLRISITVRRG
ncbi:MAG TPA: hypothetical protein PLD47_07750 [Aggregatilineales bacterium]|nr:hypothetical protein [Anaerolineales bacterium]HRE47601.1 hypothetical protein [Aggregatilineales bacterium]